ncbi:MAG: response regulator [bacterium]|nr:response regulator [bacterium]
MHELATEPTQPPLAPPRLRLVSRDVRTRVLLADDDPDLRRLLSLTLRRAGYDVVEAGDGVELLDRLESTVAKRDYFGVIVADVNMPGLTGLDVLAALRCTSWTTPVILITAFGDPATKAEADDLGAMLLDKPLDLDALRVAVRAAVDR